MRRAALLTGCLLACLAGSGAPARASTYGRLPLAFEANRGQAGPGAAFLARGAGYAVALGRRGARLHLHGAGARDGALGFDFVGVRRRTPTAAGGALKGTVSYLLGNQRRRWVRHAPTFARVRYRRLWSGIDAVFYGRRGTLEYDFDVAPRADPGAIGLRWSGPVTVGRSGALRIATGDGIVRQLVPRAYQPRHGRRHRVAARYVRRRGVIRLRLGRYDHTRRLVVDPVLTYATYLGGSGTDTPVGLHVDAAGDAYVSGVTASADFPHTGGAFSGPAGGNDLFVAKLNPAGTALLYSTFLGGSGAESGGSLAVDDTGHAIVLGTTTSTDFPVTDQAFQVSNHDVGDLFGDLFVAKLQPDGSGLAYSTYLGGSVAELSGAIALAGDGSVFVSGTSTSGDFPTTPGALGTTNSPQTAALVVAHLDATGSNLLASTYAGTTANAGAQLALGPTGDAYLATTASTEPTTDGVLQPKALSLNDGYVERLSGDLTARRWGTYLGGYGDDFPSALAVDADGRPYLALNTKSTDFPTTPGALLEHTGTGASVALARLSADGTSLGYSTFVGEPRGGFGTAIGLTLDAADDAFLTTGVSVAPTTAGAVQTANAGDSDAFLGEVDPTGSNLLYATYLGGSGTDRANRAAFGSGGSVVMSGATSSANFPVTAGAVQSTLGDATHTDAFLAKLTPSGPALRTTSLTVSCPNTPIAIGTSANCTATVSDTGTGTPASPAGALGLNGDNLQLGACTLAATATPGVATCQFTVSPITAFPSSLPLDVSYAGGPGLRPSSTRVNVPVSGGSRATSTTITCSPGSVPAKSPTSCSIGVTDTGSGTASTPTGNFVVTESGGPGENFGGCQVVGSGTVGTGMCLEQPHPYTPTGVGSGSHVLTAAYTGDSTHATSSGTFAVTVTPPVPQPVSFTLTCSPSSTPVGRSSFCQTTLSGIRPSGTITWSSSGAAAFTHSCAKAPCNILYRPDAVGTGTHTITAAYSGDDANQPASKTFDLGVVPPVVDPTTTGPSCSPTPRAVGAKLNCRVLVKDTASTGKINPTGDVTFTTSGSGTFGGGGKCTLQATAAGGFEVCFIDYTPKVRGSGTDTITASYPGDVNHSNSNGTFDEPVTGESAKSPTTTAVSCAPDHLAVGDAAKCTATVSTTGDGAPTGTVSFSTSSVCLLGSTGATQAACSVSFAPLAVGTTAIGASYGGDDTHSGSASAGGASVIAAGLASTSPTPSPTPGGGTAAVPKLSALKVSPAAVRPGKAPARAAVAKKKKKHTGATISYLDSQPATTMFSVVRKTSGRRVGKACRKPTRKHRRGKKCTLLTPAKGSLTHTDVAGPNRLAFTATLGGHKLKRGAYLLMATPSLAGVKGATATTAFKVIR